MKKGDYVIVTDGRGSFSGIIEKVNTKRGLVWVNCNCCFASKVCNIESVKVHE
jgi:hypothetical protein